jgi:uncharacterized membrane protein
MTGENPLVERYLAKLDAGLRDLPAAERAEVVSEIRNHIAEATAAGKPIDATLSALGPAEDLARGYAVELLLNRPAPKAGSSRTQRFLALAGLVAIGSIPTLIVVTVLGAFAIAFGVAGILVFVAGVFATFGWLPDYVTMDVAPWVAVLIGPILGIVGGASLALLVWYVRFTARLIRRVVPKKTPGVFLGDTVH